MSDMSEESWSRVPAALRSKNELPPDWRGLLGPLQAGSTDDLMVVGQVGQSLDGRIATPTGHSHYINCLAARAHLHRLRAVVDAVVVGVGTVIADDPQLSVRLVRGPSPARVVIDPSGRCSAQARIFANDGARRVVIAAAPDRADLPSNVELIALPLAHGQFASAAILQALAEKGFRRILVEGGPRTLSQFLAAGCLDRLHVLLAPMIIGAGPPGLELPAIERIDQALKTSMQVHRIGDDVLLDCDLSARRVPVFRERSWPA
jgi:diaminohydroxyphosphoribosylaminopyrimidine deaminase / 5-amino-6-(5-phosphoribosylamino)uracil reductase